MYYLELTPKSYELMKNTGYLWIEFEEITPTVKQGFGFAQAPSKQSINVGNAIFEWES
jgi:hypothetical protein